MSIKSAPFYWIECDFDGCESKAPDHEVSAWRDSGWALDEAADSEWAIEGSRDFPEGIGHWCPQHQDQVVCPECGEPRNPPGGPCSDDGCGWKPEGES